MLRIRKKIMPEAEISNTSLSVPYSIAFDDRSNLWVTDFNRILMYKADRRNPDLFYNGQPASLVLGQPDFTSYREPNPPTAGSLSVPIGITFDASNLWVCDDLNHRVLMYKADWTNPGFVL